MVSQAPTTQLKTFFFIYHLDAISYYHSHNILFKSSLKIMYVLNHIIFQ